MGLRATGNEVPDPCHTWAPPCGDLAVAYDAMQGRDPEDPHLAGRPTEKSVPELGKGLEGLRIGVLGGYFALNGNPEAFAAVARSSTILSKDQIQVGGVVAVVDAGAAASWSLLPKLMTCCCGRAITHQGFRAVIGTCLVRSWSICCWRFWIC